MFGTPSETILSEADLVGAGVITKVGWTVVETNLIGAARDEVMRQRWQERVWSAQA